MSRVIAICNQKGGVSKTTTSFSLCNELAKRGKKVLAVDGDQQASLSLLFGVVKPDELKVSLTELFLAEARDLAYDVNDVILQTDKGIDLLPASITLSQAEMELINMMFGRESVLKNILAHVKDNYDYIIIDCPPSLGIITVNILTAANEVIIPVQASIFSIAGMQLLLNTIIKTKKNFNPNLLINGIVFAMVQGGTTFSQDVIDQVSEMYGDGMYVYRTQLPRSIIAERASANLQTSTDFDSSSKLGVAYSNFADEFLETVGD